ncbi:hypothetical protein FPV67DRAFT_1473511 [Lyophyllum atratum]|nr:hypothetical protein FPV67DRAFT_1473511 [Lyophyllum atratum]
MSLPCRLLIVVCLTCSLKQSSWMMLEAVSHLLLLCYLTTTCLLPYSPSTDERVALALRHGLGPLVFRDQPSPVPTGVDDLFRI